MNLPSSWGFKVTFCEPNIVLVSRKRVRNVHFYLVSAHVYLTGHQGAWRWGVWICNKPSLVYAVLIVVGYGHASRGIGGASEIALGKKIQPQQNIFYPRQALPRLYIACTTRFQSIIDKASGLGWPNQRQPVKHLKLKV